MVMQVGKKYVEVDRHNIGYIVATVFVVAIFLLSCFWLYVHFGAMHEEADYYCSDDYSHCARAFHGAMILLVFISFTVVVMGLIAFAMLVSYEPKIKKYYIKGNGKKKEVKK